MVIQEKRLLPREATKNNTPTFRTVYKITRVFSVVEYREIASTQSRFSVISKNKSTSGFATLGDAVSEAIRRQEWINNN